MRARPTQKPLDRQAIVITGATSGIGLATARRAARAGACVFLISRGEGDLKALVEELQGQGARVAYAVADVADYDALAEAADKCRRLFGGFDTWVNNAGVSIFGAIRDTTLEDQRRLFETNYWGIVNGSLIAAEHLKAQAQGGTIINIGSVLSDSPLPIQGVYSASKHAVKGFTNALRMELMREGAPVQLSLVKPAAVDTPYSRHARNLTNHAVQNPQPVYATHVVADAVLWCATHPVREITVGLGGRLIASFYALLPGIAEPLFAAFTPRMMRDPDGVWDPELEGLWGPAEDGLIEEVKYPMVRQFSALAEIRKHPGIAGGVIAILAGVGLATLLLNQRSGPTRLERFKMRLDPRGWVDSAGLRDRWDDLAAGVRHGLLDAGAEAERRKAEAGRWLGGRRRQVEALSARGGRYARDHAREGGALIAIATIAAAIGAAALEANRARTGRID